MGEVHWRAFQEQPISAGQAKAGPATHIVEELFTERSATIGFGSSDAAAIIREPAGQQAIGDRIALIQRLPTIEDASLRPAQALHRAS